MIQSKTALKKGNKHRFCNYNSCYEGNTIVRFINSAIPLININYIYNPAEIYESRRSFSFEYFLTMYI